MIAQFDPAIYAQGDASSHGSNAPLPKRDIETLRRTFGEIQDVASMVFEDVEPHHPAEAVDAPGQAGLPGHRHRKARHPAGGDHGDWWTGSAGTPRATS